MEKQYCPVCGYIHQCKANSLDDIAQRMEEHRVSEARRVSTIQVEIDWLGRANLKLISDLEYKEYTRLYTREASDS